MEIESWKHPPTHKTGLCDTKQQRGNSINRVSSLKDRGQRIHPWFIGLGALFASGSLVVVVHEQKDRYTSSY